MNSPAINKPVKLYSDRTLDDLLHANMHMPMEHMLIIITFMLAWNLIINVLPSSLLMYLYMKYRYTLTK